MDRLFSAHFVPLDNLVDSFGCLGAGIHKPGGQRWVAAQVDMDIGSPYAAYLKSLRTVVLVNYPVDRLLRVGRLRQHRPVKLMAAHPLPPAEQGTVGAGLHIT